MPRTEPQDGDRKEERGLEYVYQDGRWWAQLLEYTPLPTWEELNAAPVVRSHWPPDA